MVVWLLSDEMCSKAKGGLVKVPTVLLLTTMVLLIKNISYYFKFLFSSSYKEILKVVENPTSGNIAARKDCK